MSKKAIKITLQRSLLQHLGKDYAALVLTIKTMWKNKTTDLADIIFRVIRYAKINKRNNKDSTDVKVMAASIHWAPKGTCTTKKYVEKGVTIHYTDWCWVLHPKLYAKYSLYQMRPKRLNQNLKKIINPTETVDRREELAVLEIDSWQPKVLIVKGSQQDCWLVDLATNIYVYNDWLLIIEYWKQLTRIGSSTSDRISLGQRKIQLRLALKNGTKGLILNLQNIYYLSNRPCNLVSLGLLNNSGIYHDNENETLYKVQTRPILAQA